ncbi:MAG: GNAT family N-acetyltransferase [Burkholderiales bacterium]
MRILALDRPLDGALARALDRFEHRFSYPLGATQRFHVLHGADYSRFFRAMGEARCLVAEEGGDIVGSLAAVIRHIWLPDGTGLDVGYIGDLRVAPEARSGWTLIKLAGEAASWVSRSAKACFGVVMDGTPGTPDRYTGRAGIPTFDAIAKVSIARIPTSHASGNADAAVTEVEARVASRCFRDLSAGRYATPCANPAERSLSAPVWLKHLDGSACGCLEDTLRAKRLILEDGAEMLSAHLSCFAYRDAGSGAALIRDALARARRLEFPALFVAVTAADAGPLLSEFEDSGVTLASATVFGKELVRNVDWNINTSEI